MTRATPGTRIRITVDQCGAPVGSVVQVAESNTRYAVYYDHGLSTLASHDSYEIIDLEETP